MQHIVPQISSKLNIWHFSGNLKPIKVAMPLGIGRTSLTAVQIMAMGNPISTEPWQIMNMPNFGGFSVIYCGNTELNYIKHSFNHFQAV
jgi:hypothetical protein